MKKYILFIWLFGGFATFGFSQNNPPVKLKGFWVNYGWGASTTGLSSGASFNLRRQQNVFGLQGIVCGEL
jgi:hypothetical protein